MRAPVDHIAAPPFPPGLPWINVAALRMDEQLGRPVLIEFWDFCRANSIRTLPYMKAWHERYADLGLRVVGVHAAGFEPSHDPAAVADAVRRLEIPYPVVVDAELEIWDRYGNLGWPGRYLFNQDGMLFDQHYGEGAYDETERAIQELLGIERPVLEPMRPEDAPGAVLEPQTEDIEGPYSGPYRAGGVWAVLDGYGGVTVNQRCVSVEGPGCYELIAHPWSTEGRLELQLDEGIRCHAVCFTPGLASDRLPTRAG
jgi:AhpC/TSA family